MPAPSEEPLGGDPTSGSSDGRWRMNRNAIGRSETTPGDPYSEPSARWAIVVLGSHTFSFALWAGVVGLALGVPLRGMLVPFAMFALCRLLLTPLLAWSYRADARPKAGAFRMGLAWFVHLQAFMAALELTEVWLGKESLADAVSIAPFLVVCIALISGALYFWWRRRLEGVAARERSRIS
jgi:hypothetical protein